MDLAGLLCALGKGVLLCSYNSGPFITKVDLSLQDSGPFLCKGSSSELTNLPWLRACVIISFEHSVMMYYEGV